MRLRVNPNRMVLLTLKKRLAVAIRGHKLLKDKLEGMIKEFIVSIKDFREKSKKIDDEFLNLEKIFKSRKIFIIFKITTWKRKIRTIIKTKSQSRFKCREKKCYGCYCP